MTTLVDRYRQLLAVIPPGQFYDSTGMVVPHRTTPYNLKIQGDSPNTQYLVRVNGVSRGIVTSGVDGDIQASILLDLGDNNIEFISQVTGKVLSTWLTARSYATWLAALAELVSSIDEATEGVLSEARLATATSSLIGRVFGTPVFVQNDFNYGLDSFRLLLEQLRYAFRYYGGTNRAIADAVRAFTNISPLIFDRLAIKRLWRLGWDLLWHDQRLDVPEWTYGPLRLRPPGSPVPTSNISGPAAGFNIVASHNLSRGDVVAVTVTGAPSSPIISWTLNGSPGLFPRTLLAPGRYKLELQSNTSIHTEHIYTTAKRRVDTVGSGGGTTLRIMMEPGYQDIDITLTSSPSKPVADIYNEINAAVSSHPAFSNYSEWANPARAYDPQVLGYDDDRALELYTNIGIGRRSIFVKLPPTEDEVVQAEFNIPYIRNEVEAVAIGQTVLQLKHDEYMENWPTATPESPIYCIMRDNIAFTARWNSPLYSDKAAVSSPYERFKVIGVDKVARTLTVDPPAAQAHGDGSMIYLEGTDVAQASVVDDYAYIVFDVKTPALLTNGTDTFTIGSSTAETGLPAGWYASPPSIQRVEPSVQFFGTDYNLWRYLFTFPLSTLLPPPPDNRRTSPYYVDADTEISIPISDEMVRLFAGHLIGVSIWYSEHGGVLYNDSTGQASASNLSVFVNGAFFASVPVTTAVNRHPAINMPRNSYATFTLPPNSNTCRISFQLTSGVPMPIELHAVKVYPVDLDLGISQGFGTIPQSASTVNAGSAIYIWSPNPLSSSEDAALGLSSSTSVTEGTIERVAQAHSSLQKFDITTYDIGGSPTNLYGAWTDAHFAAGTRTNLTIVPQSPARFSYMNVDQPSILTTQVQFSPVGPHTAPLTITSSQNLARSTLTENGVPVPQDQWQYNSGAQIQLLYTPLGGATYVLEYEVLHRFEGAPIDLGPAVNNKRIYYADYHVFARPDFEPVPAQVTQQLVFNDEGLATLDEVADLNKSLATLTIDRGLGREVTVSNNEWDFVDNLTVRVSPSLVSQSAVYTFQYTALVAYPKDVVEVKMEFKTATTLGGLATASYTTVVREQKMVVSRYVQLRLTVSNVREIGDAKIMSLSIRELSLLPGSVPVLS